MATVVRRDVVSRLRVLGRAEQKLLSERPAFRCHRAAPRGKIATQGPALP